MHLSFIICWFTFCSLFLPMLQFFFPFFSCGSFSPLFLYVIFLFFFVIFFFFYLLLLRCLYRSSLQLWSSFSTLEAVTLFWHGQTHLYSYSTIFTPFSSCLLHSLKYHFAFYSKTFQTFDLEWYCYTARTCIWCAACLVWMHYKIKVCVDDHRLQMENKPICNVLLSFSFFRF